MSQKDTLLTILALLMGLLFSVPQAQANVSDSPGTQAVYICAMDLMADWGFDRGMQNIWKDGTWANRNFLIASSICGSKVSSNSKSLRLTPAEDTIETAEAVVEAGR